MWVAERDNAEPRRWFPKQQPQPAQLAASASARDRFLSPDVFLDGGIVPGKTFMGPALSTVVDFLRDISQYFAEIRATPPPALSLVYG